MTEPEAPRCVLHPDTPSDGPCARCGNFGCRECLVFVDRQRICSNCIARQIAALPPLEPRAALARLGLAGTAALWTVFLAMLFVPRVGRLIVGLPPWTLPAAMGAAYVMVGVLYLRWFSLAVRFCVADGVGTAFQAISAWVLPLYSFVKPYEMTGRMLKATGAPAKWLLPWQVSYVLAQLMSYFTKNHDLLPFWCALHAAAAIAGMLVVRDTTNGITARARRLSLPP